jgi:hypothetical protein
LENSLADPEMPKYRVSYDSAILLIDVDQKNEKKYVHTKIVHEPGLVAHTYKSLLPEK